VESLHVHCQRDDHPDEQMHLQPRTQHGPLEDARPYRAAVPRLASTGASRRAWSRAAPGPGGRWRPAGCGTNNLGPQQRQPARERPHDHPEVARGRPRSPAAGPGGGRRRLRGGRHGAIRPGLPDVAPEAEAQPRRDDQHDAGFSAGKRPRRPKGKVRRTSEPRVAPARALAAGDGGLMLDHLHRASHSVLGTNLRAESRGPFPD
jgi:hypothetical protein